MHQVTRPLSSRDITRPGQRHRFLWHQYSERCGAIAAPNFETVYYFAFRQRDEAQSFARAIARRFRSEAAVRPCKRFSPGPYLWEVKVWGMPESAFLGLVWRDRQANPPEQGLLTV
jgi:hypothetical protein